jgi:beta-galactosidase
MASGPRGSLRLAPIYAGRFSLERKRMTLNRRTFVQAATTCVAGVALERGLWAGSPPGEEQRRAILPLNQRWRYGRGAGEEARARDFNDASFQTVVLPHANLELPWHEFDQNSYQFVSVYRRELRLPALGSRRVFLDFEGVMAATTVWLNGGLIGEYKGGYTPFSFELTAHLDREGRNVLAVEVDSRELPEVPPFGYEIDYLTFGGIYREVSLRIVSSLHIEDICARPSGVTAGRATLDVLVYLSQRELSGHADSLEVALLEEETIVASARIKFSQFHDVPDALAHALQLQGLAGIVAWDLDNPHLYTVRVRLLADAKIVDEDSRRVGFRTASFTERGFELNGRAIKLRGLNRHQTYPYAGGAMPARVQRRDATILKKALKCNIVRTSHYPQSKHFLDACDEQGLLVLEEIPGWQHIGDEVWQERAIDNVRRMIHRDWNRPSIVLWSVRINESGDDHALYSKTNAVARMLDPTRQTIGVRNFQDSEFLEDVFGMNDFGFPLKAPNHTRYLNTEFVGAEWPVRSSDNNAVQREHVLRYARIYNQLASDPGYAGGLGWCAFDYNTHADFGAGDHVCYMGVMDMFREPKAAAGFYRSQCEPEVEPVLEPAFHFADNDEPGDFREEVICSNCDTLKCFIKPLDAPDGHAFHPIVELTPAREHFPHLAHPPFFLSLPNGNDDWGDLRIDGYVQGAKAISKTISGRGVIRRLEVTADDGSLFADGSDATRVVMRVTDEYGNVQRLCDDPLRLMLSGPATLVGPRTVALTGGTIAVWIRAMQQPGRVRFSAAHEILGTKEVEIGIAAALQEAV